MSQAYGTTYKHFHKWHDIDRRASLAPRDRFAESLPDYGNWLVFKSLEEQKESGMSLDAAEKCVFDMYRHRYWSTYQVHYCQDMIPKEGFVAEVSENELLESCNLLYGPKTQEILPPRVTARRIYGYLRPNYAYTPLTFYQLVHGVVAYDILRNSFEREQAAKKVKIDEQDTNVASKEIAAEKTKDSKLESKTGKVESKKSEAAALKRQPGVHKFPVEKKKYCVCCPCELKD